VGEDEKKGNKGEPRVMRSAFLGCFLLAKECKSCRMKKECRRGRGNAVRLGETKKLLTARSWGGVPNRSFCPLTGGKEGDVLERERMGSLCVKRGGVQKKNEEEKKACWGGGEKERLKELFKLLS